MKSLQESLFDQDIARKDVKIDFDTLRDMLFDFGRKYTLGKEKKLFDKVGVAYHEGRQCIFIKRFVDDSQRKGAVCFELEFGVTNVYTNSYSKDRKLVAAFKTPVLKASDKEPWSSGFACQWKYSQTDPNATTRLLNKTFDFGEELWTNTIIASSNDVGSVFGLYDKIVKYFCSDEFGKILQKYVNDWEKKQAIPGIILDGLMKKLIKEA